MFNSARLKLTAWYLLVIMLVSISFSMIIYQFLSREVDRFARNENLRFQRQIIFPEDPMRIVPLPVFDPEITREIKNKLKTTLGLINGTILIGAGVLGYLLAGKTLSPIKDMVDEQNRFISDASHELRTPLTALKSAFEVNLRDKRLNLKQAKLLIKDSLDDVNRLQSLSDNMLELIHFQKPNKPPLMKLDIQTVINKSIDRVKYLALQKKITIEDRSQSYVISGNQEYLIDLFVILLDNAIKYSPPDSHILISNSIINNRLIINVRDQGIGIASSDLPHLFDRFFRADSARTANKSTGYGLGLSIAKKIADLHDASITVKSKLNRGSVFSVIFQV